MKRAEAKDFLEDQHFKNMSTQDRKEILDELWIFCDSEAWFDEDDLRYFPKDIRKDMLENDSPHNPADPKYDFIIRDVIKGIFTGIKNAYLLNMLKSAGMQIDEINSENELLAKCDCCDYRTISPGADGLAEICPVCFWENFGEGPNGMSLEEARANFNKFGAMSQSCLKSIDPDGPKKYAL